MTLATTTSETIHVAAFVYLKDLRKAKKSLESSYSSYRLLQTNSTATQILYSTHASTQKDN